VKTNNELVNDEDDLVKDDLEFNNKQFDNEKLHQTLKAEIGAELSDNCGEFMGHLGWFMGHCCEIADSVCGRKVTNIAKALGDEYCRGIGCEKAELGFFGGMEGCLGVFGVRVEQWDELWVKKV